ncbi:MAG: divalent metal cation transporter [Thermoplasmataceae archaeon]
MMADMDASSIIGAAETGALYHYDMIWFLVLLIMPLYYIQVTSGRIGLATGSGLGETIRDNFGKKIALAATLPMAITDVITYVAEYLGIALGFDILGVPAYVSLPIVFVAHIAVLLRGQYRNAERIMLGVSFILIASFVLELTFRGILPDRIIYISTERSYLFFIAANAGAVVMPFMLFFQASATARKLPGKFRDANSVKKTFSKIRKETLAGAVTTEALMIIVEMVATGTPNYGGFVSARDIALSLDGVAGPLSPYVFAVGIIAAGFLALVIVSLGSAWGVVEAAGLGDFGAYVLYVVESIPALAAGLLIPEEMLLNAVLYVLVIFVFALIGPGILLGFIGSSRKIMGRMAMNRREMAAYSGSLIFVIACGIIYVASSFL